MTKLELFKSIRNFIENATDLPDGDRDVYIEGLDNEINLLIRKASTPRKPTANQIENESLSAEIVAYLTEVDTLKSIKELQEEIPSLSALSNQRISHILSALVNTGKLEKSYVKKTPFFCVK